MQLKIHILKKLKKNTVNRVATSQTNKSGIVVLKIIVPEETGLKNNSHI